MPQDNIVEIVEVGKFNPYHDEKGRFATAQRYASFTYSPGKSKAHDNAIAREKERQAAAANSGTRIDGVDIADKLPEPSKVPQELPELKGTPKQVAWAEKIREQAYADLANNLVSPYMTTENYNKIAVAMHSKETMAEYIRNNRLVQSTSGTVRQEKIDAACKQLHEFSRREKAFLDIMANDSAQFWIDNRGRGHMVGLLEGTSKPKTSSGGSSDALRWYDKKPGYKPAPSSSTSPSSGGGSSGKLVIPRGGKLPSDLSGVNRISGDTYANKDKIKAAGFKWDSQNREWVRPGVAKSAEFLLDDCPYEYITIIEVGESKK